MGSDIIQWSNWGFGLRSLKLKLSSPCFRLGFGSSPRTNNSFEAVALPSSPTRPRNYAQVKWSLNDARGRDRQRDLKKSTQMFVVFVSSPTYEQWLMNDSHIWTAQEHAQIDQLKRNTCRIYELVSPLPRTMAVLLGDGLRLPSGFAGVTRSCASFSLRSGDELTKKNPIEGNAFSIFVLHCAWWIAGRSRGRKGTSSLLSWESNGFSCAFVFFFLHSRKSKSGAKKWLITIYTGINQMNNDEVGRKTWNDPPADADLFFPSFRSRNTERETDFFEDFSGAPSLERQDRNVYK